MCVPYAQQDGSSSCAEQQREWVEPLTSKHHLTTHTHYREELRMRKEGEGGEGGGGGGRRREGKEEGEEELEEGGGEGGGREEEGRCLLHQHGMWATGVRGLSSIQPAGVWRP